MKPKYWLAPLAIALAGSTLLLASALPSHASVAVAAVPSVPATLTPTRPPGKVSKSALAAPDLVVESITFSPTHPGIGEGVDITVTIKNQGDAIARDFHAYLYLDPADRPPTITTPHTAHTYWGAPLNPGVPLLWASTNHTFTVTGTHPIYAWVDRDDDVEESDEANNLAGPVNVPVGTACIPDAHELDDLCTQANPIAADGTDQPHNLCPAPDKDWVKFDAVGGVTYLAQAIPDGLDADPVIELHGECGSPPSFGSGSEIEFTAVTSSTYYFKVEHVSPTYGPDTGYSLRLTPLEFCNGHHEPNDTCATAADVAVGAAPQPHTFCRAGDADWVRFPTIAGSTYVISATHAGADADTRLSLYSRCEAGPALTGRRRLEYTAPISGVAYVEAKHPNRNTYGPDTEYALQVIRASDCALDDHEPDDTAATAGTLAAGEPAQTHDFCPAGDADWMRFDATAGVTYTMETLNLAGAADTVLCLFAASGTARLACDDDGGPGYGSRIAWQAPADGTYALQVTDYNPQVAGPGTRYNLHVFAGPCLADEQEPDDTQATAHPIDTDGTRQAHNTCPAGDVDWVYFTTPAGRQLIETTGLGPEADTFIELYDASGRRLAFNDDYDAGTASSIYYRFDDGGTYYVKVRHYNPTRYGTGTEYSLRVYWDISPPTPTPPPPVPPTATPTPPPSGVRTIILVNREQVAALYGEAAAAQLITWLNALAHHSDVQGEVVRLDLNDTVSAAYAAWNADLTNTVKANQVAAAIRGVVMTYLQQRDGVEFIVLVGDDRLLPFRRIPDSMSPCTPSECVERDYVRKGGDVRVDGDHPTGAALRANYFLSDDYYADRDPTPFQGRELYIPDLAVGRLIETPAEIIAFIDEFLNNPPVTLGQVLVTGYDFVQDAATAICSDWQDDLGAESVEFLIGDGWTADELRERQLDAAPPFKVQSINGHADHYREGAPHGQPIDAGEISSASSDLSRGLIYTPGCHSGLNVPPTNAIGPLDLAQAFAQKKANYVGNTGYGWGVGGAIGLSERLMRLYTDELRSGKSINMGQALSAAKQRYYREGQHFTDHDEKVIEELVFYGLPMSSLNTGNGFGPTADPFPSVEITPSLPAAFGDETVVTGTVAIQLTGALGPGDVMSRAVTADGVYYLLDGHVHAVPGQPVQPLFYADVTAAGWPARSVIFREGEYETLTGFDPVVVSPVNDTLTQTAEVAFDAPGWYPPVPVGVQTQGGETSLVVQMGQYDPSVRQARLYGSMALDLYYSLSDDRTPPRFTVVDGLYDRATGQVALKVGATDWTGVQRAVATYTRGDGRWDSVELGFDYRLHKWTGSFPGDTNARYLVQVVDGAGNVAWAANKGLYYAPAIAPTPAVSIYLPLVLRQ